MNQTTNVIGYYPMDNFRPTKRFHDLTGKRFGRLTVLELVDIDVYRNFYWLCQCDCGNYTRVQGGRLTHNLTRSCGCLVADTNRMLRCKKKES